MKPQVVRFECGCDVEMPEPFAPKLKCPEHKARRWFVNDDLATPGRNKEAHPDYDPVLG